MAHVAVSAITGNDLWQLDDAEGDKLATAVQKVTRHYNIPDVASETKDWIGLIIVAGTVYGTRFAAAWADKKAPETPPTREQSDNVVALQATTVGAINHPGPGL